MKLGTLELDGSRYFISKDPPSQTAADKTIEVFVVTPSLSTDDLLLWLESARYDGGKIVHHVSDESCGVLTVTFENPKRTTTPFLVCRLT